jgi:hypothetical protein
MDIDITYKRKGNLNYVVVSCVRQQEVKLESYKTQMLLNNKLPVSLPLQINYINNMPQFLYEITGRCSVAQYCQDQKLTGRDIRQFIENLWGLLEQLSDFLLEPDAILLEPELVYRRQTDRAFEFCVAPICYKPFEKQLKQWMQSLIGMIDYNDKQGVTLAYELQILVENGIPARQQVEELITRIWKQREKRADNIEAMSDFVDAPNSELKETGKGLQPEEIYKKPTLLQRLFSRTTKKDKKGVKTTVAKVGEDSYERASYEQALGTLYSQQLEVEETVVLNSQVYGLQEILLREIHDQIEDGHLPLEGGMIGRNAEQVHMYIEDRSVSRIHAKIYREQGQYYIEDLNSTNGTALNGVELAPYSKAKLQSQDMLKFGNFTFRIALPIDKKGEKG